MYKEQGRFHEIEKELHANNERGRGIFFAVNHGGHDDVSITRINAQFVEMDDMSLEEQLERIKRFPLPPSLIVKTRKSLHCYWLMDEKAQVSEFRHIQRQLVKQFNGDPACINESRVFRLPNFYHHKEEPIMVECIKFNPELRYSQRELSEQLPDVPVEVNPDAPRQTTESVTQKGLVITGTRCC
ncbi:MAG: RepB family DNA primase, partial [Oscillospiraceae bacterium]|nr:RepB family DNA primase [Oscillospiraceae bacterium]